ncbi:MAG: DUF5686 and carboxypeptidase regulatory-like domain-containing protein [Flavobacteriales bacterium]|nr:DUF5686 and carboxypeptidase regulatory-like domain-containing protein [Flavobacteriales bacterium]
MMKKFILIGFVLHVFVGMHAQVLIFGEVTDARTRKPLAFANIYEQGKNNGTFTDIDGKFKLKVESLPSTIQFSIIGYRKQVLTITESNRADIFIQLEPLEVELKEVVIFPGINPAEELVKKLLARRDTLNPNKLDAYTYTAYHKFLFTTAVDTSLSTNSELYKNLKDSLRINDTMNRQLNQFLDKNHLFINESVTEKRFMKPDRNYELVIASKTSGMQLPIISTLITQLQSLSFYENTFSIFGMHYINPISKAGLKSYWYEIADTTFSGNDTVIVINYQPRKNLKDESLLKGVLNVNLKHLALETGIAIPTNTDEGIHLTIRQQYARMDSIHWFPVQLNTDISSNFLVINEKKLIGEGRTYIKNIQINPKLKAGQFGAIEIDVDEHAVKDNEKILPQYREYPLSGKDSSTYRVLDSLGKALKLDRRIMALEAILTGKLRIRFIDIDLNRIFTYNNYEGVRLGAGLSTNNQLVKWWLIGGHFGYGFKDKAFKYGAYTEFIPHRKTDTRIRLEYKRDLAESGNQDIPLEAPFNLDNIARSYTLNIFDSIHLFEGSVRFKPVQNLHLRLGFNHQIVDPTLPYRYLPDTTFNQQFKFTELQFTARWGIKEKYFPLGHLYLSMGTQYPILWLHIAQGIPALNNPFTYTRIFAKIEETLDFKKAGKLRTILSGGIVFGDVPYNRMFNERGSFATFSIVARSAFETMRPNEFVSDKFISWFLSYNFGILFKVGKVIRPEFSLVHNLGFGWMKEPLRHQGIPFKTMEKGFFEGGFVIDKLLYFNGTGFGVGTFYRYGTYVDPVWYKNFYVKMSVTFGL